MSFGNEEVESDRINNLLEEIGLDQFKNKIPFELSGGQKQRLLIAIAALSNVNLLMFDEPTSGLDYINMNKVSNILKNLSRENALIIATHDIEFLYKTCNRIIYLENKKIKKDFYLDNKNKSEVQEIFMNMGE